MPAKKQKRLSRKLLRDYLHSQAVLVHDLLAHYRETLDPEDLHRLRVALKKCRAWIWLQRRSDNPLPETTVGQLRRVFAHAGKVRAVLVHLELLRQYMPRRSEKVAGLADKAELLSRGFAAKTVGYQRKINAAAQNLLRKVAAPEEKQAEKLLHAQTRKALRRLREKFGDTALHDCRKKLKRILYLRSMAPETSPLHDKKEIRRLHHLQDLIGQWHDVDLFIRLLENAGPGSSAAVRKAGKERERLLRGIRKELRGK